MQITSGIKTRAWKVVIYGPEGIGKSTLASKFPDPLFIDTEGGTVMLDVKRIDAPQLEWGDIVEYVKQVSRSDVCSTLVIDTADWAEQKCMQYVCRKNGKTSIEAFGYGKGYTYLGEEFALLLQALDGCIKAGINVVVLAHAKMRKFEQPDEQGAYDRWEMKLSRQVAPMLKEWADMVLFLNYKTYVVESDNGKKKATGGKRVMYAAHHPCWDAKNRHGLPEEMPMEYEQIAHLFHERPAQTPLQPQGGDLPEVLPGNVSNSGKTKKPGKSRAQAGTPYERVKQLMASAPVMVTPEDLHKVMAKNTQAADVDGYSDALLEFIANNWSEIYTKIEENRNLPF